MTLLAFYGGLVLGVAAGMTLMALLIVSRNPKPPLRTPPPNATPAVEDWGPPPENK